MTSSPPVLKDDLNQILADGPPAIGVLILPGVLMYLSLYALAKRWNWTSRVFAVLSLLFFWRSTHVATVRCAALRSEFNFGVAVAIMKLLDIQILSLTNSFPTYSAGRPPPPSAMAFFLMTELRWESFTPNPIRNWPMPRYPFSSSPKMRRFFYSEKIQLFIHIGLFILLQSLPQYLPVKALGILLSIWIIWTAIELTVRYRTSPPLFGPIYLADSLATFWTETWHNVFAAPCISIAYTPTMYLLSCFAVPRVISRSLAVIASFSLMAVFHMYALSPLLSDEGMRRIGIFFVANGVLTVTEAWIWGKKRDWRRAIIAWVLELALASWTVDAAEVADGVLNADWRGLCRAKTK